MLSAVVGGQADASVLAAFAVTPAIERGAVKFLGYVGDETPWQLKKHADDADERR